MTKRREYPQWYDGEWVRVPMRGFREQCCDCRLVHRLNFRLREDARGHTVIEIQAFRDGKATGGSR